MTKTQMVVREFTVDDAESVRTLANKCQPLLVNGVYVNLFLAKYFGNMCFILEDSGTAVGFITGLKSTTNPNIFFLWQLGLAPEYRGKKLSSRLIEAIVTAARNNGCKSVQLSISPGNEESFGTFQSFTSKHSLELRAIEEQKYRDPLSGKEGHEIFYEFAI